MSETTDTDFESTEAQVQRIVFTGTAWFAAALVASAVTIGGLLASGWRPSDLAGPDAFAWWMGSFIALVGIGGLAWAGCPVMGFPLPIAEQQKVLCMRAGTVLFIAGSVIAVVAILISPGK